MKSPFAHRKLGALDRFCLRAIAFYQRHLSPRKGYRCAYARTHGGGGCSGFAREAILRHGFGAALPQIRARFGACKSAARTLRAQVDLDKSGDSAALESQHKRSRRNKWSDACCVDFSWICCADSLLDGSACQALSCADASCAEGACACHSCW